jgi:DNA-binding NarL/FixJ family response regulator
VEAEPDWSVCGEAADGQQATEQAVLLTPHLVILDIHMPVMNGFEVAKILRARSPEILVLIVTTDCSRHFSLAASSSGAQGFLDKSRSHTHLVEAIAALLKGEKYFQAV